MHKVLICLFCLSGLWLSLIANATTLTGLSNVSIPVMDYSEQSIQKALPKAMIETLVRLSGNPSVDTLPQVRTALNKVNHYVLSYSYNTQNDAAGKQQLILQINFDQKALKKLLRQSSQAIWQSQRPLTLVLIAIRQNNDYQILSSDGNNPWQQTIAQVASERGIPIIFPTMDLTDQNILEVNDQQTPLTTELTQEAKRYGVSSIIFANLTVDATQAIQGEWTLLLNNSPFQWQSSDSNLNNALQQGMERSVSMMAEQLATLNEKDLQSTVLLQLNNVDNLSDYTHVLNKLRHFSIVSNAEITGMQNDALLVSVNVAGGAEALAKALNASKAFTANTDITHQYNQKADLYYQWGTKPSTPTDFTQGFTRQAHQPAAMLPPP